MKKKTAAKESTPVEVVHSFKGFDKNMRCRDYQFEIGKTYTHEGKVEACSSGFHACEYPLDVFNYYEPASSQFAVVEQTGEISRHDYDSKVASSSLTVKASIDIPGLIKAAIEFVSKRCDPAKEEHATGYRSASSATGYSSASSATGDSSASLTTGWCSRSEIKTAAEDKHLHAVAIATGGESKARAPEGSAIVLCFRNNEGELIHIRSSKVGENGIKPNVFYTLNSDGEFVEA